MPAHTNPAGDIFGGWIMASMDAAAVMTTTRLVGGRAVTVAVSNIAFLRPVKVGDAVCFYTDVKRVGQTSITLDVEVWVLRHGCDQRIKVTQADFTFVAIGEDGRPRTNSARAQSYRDDGPKLIEPEIPPGRLRKSLD